MRTMSEQEINAFLSHGTRTGKLATVREDGRPHAAPIWFVLDPETGDLLFNTGAETIKGKNLRRDPRLTIVVDDETPPYAYVLVEGIATLSDDSAAMLPWATAIGGRYMGAENAEAFGRRNAVPGELLVRVRRVKTIGQADIAS